MGRRGLRRGAHGWLMIALFGCSGSAPGDPCEDDPCACESIADVMPETLPEAEIAFDVWHDGSIESYAWSEAAGNTVECQRLDCLQNVVTLRFAAAGGGPVLEMDVCGAAERVIFTPLSPPSFPDCMPMQRGVEMRWRDGDAWASGPAADPCRLLITLRGSAVTGTFECAGLRSESGSEVRLATGSFECAIEPAP